MHHFCENQNECKVVQYLKTKKPSNGQIKNGYENKYAVII